MQHKALTPARPGSHGLRNICVYCGSGVGTNPAFAEAASDFGRELADNGIGLVFGGGGRGLMGEIARAALQHGGHVVGIIPRFLVGPEHALKDVTELVVTESMHERKLRMFERSDAFVALPGGIGTLEELVEQLTWNQIGQHNKPIIIANVLGYWDLLLALLEHMQHYNFIRADLKVCVDVVASVDEIIPTIAERLHGSASEPRLPPEKL
jgi:uncharacterized protein (TIGR00730 family)